jgi:hypothetical protein
MESKKTSKWKPWHTWAIIVCIALIIIISLIPRKVADSDTVSPAADADSIITK